MISGQDHRPNAILRRVAIGLLLLITSAGYVFVAVVQGPSEEYYAALAANLLHGRTTLPVRPRPELLRLEDPYDPQENHLYRSQDASLYKGRYYLYFGVVPAVTLYDRSQPFKPGSGAGFLYSRIFDLLCAILFHRAS